MNKKAPQSLPQCACCCWLKDGLFCRVQIVMGKLTVRCRSTNFYYISHLSISKFIRSVSHSSGSSGRILIILLLWKQSTQLSPWIPLISVQSCTVLLLTSAIHVQVASFLTTCASCTITDYGAKPRLIFHPHWRVVMSERSVRGFQRGKKEQRNTVSHFKFRCTINIWIVVY